VLGFVATASAQSWDLGNDFGTVNGTGPWKLGYGSGAGAPYNFTAFTKRRTLPIGTDWYTDGGAEIWKNSHTYQDYGVPAAGVSLVSDNGVPVARWVAPYNGTFSLDVTLGGTLKTGLHGYGNRNVAGANVSINGLVQSPSFTSTSTSNDQREWHLGALHLLRGMTIDASVPPHPDGGSTATSFSVVGVPDVTDTSMPSIAWMNGIGSPRTLCTTASHKVIVGTDIGTVLIYNESDMTLQKTIIVPNSEWIYSVSATGTTGNTMLAVCTSSIVRIYRLEDGALIWAAEAPSGGWSRAEFSNSGNHLACFGSVVKIYDSSHHNSLDGSLTGTLPVNMQYVEWSPSADQLFGRVYIDPVRCIQAFDVNGQPTGDLYFDLYYGDLVLYGGTSDNTPFSLMYGVDPSTGNWGYGWFAPVRAATHDIFLSDKFFRGAIAHQPEESFNYRQFRSRIKGGDSYIFAQGEDNSSGILGPVSQVIDLYKNNAFVGSFKVNELPLQMANLFYGGTPFSPTADLQHVAMSTKIDYAGGSDAHDRTRVYDLSGVVTASANGHATYNVVGVAWSPDGRLLATAGGDGDVILTDAKTGRYISRFTPYQYLYPAGILQFSPDSKTLLVVYGQNGSFGGHPILLYDVADPSSPFLIRSLGGTGYSAPNYARFSVDGKSVVTLIVDGTYKALTFSVADGSITGVLDRGVPYSGSSFALTADGKKVVTGVGVQDLATGEYLTRFNVEYSAIVRISPDETYALVVPGLFGRGGADMYLLDMKTGARVRSFNDGYIKNDAVFSPNGKYIYVAEQTEGQSHSAVIRVFNIATGALVRDYTKEIGNAEGDNYFGGASALTFSPDDRMWAFGRNDAVTAVAANDFYTSITLDRIVAPETLVGGSNAVCEVDLAEPLDTTSGGTVTLSAGGSSLVTIPATVKASFGQYRFVFSLGSVPVATATPITLTATFGGGTVTKTVTLLPPDVLSCSLTPPILTGGLDGTGKVKLTAPAPSPGVVVSLSADKPSIVSVPSSVTIPTGTTTASFSFHANVVKANATVKVTATTGTTPRVGTTKIVPTVLQSATLSTDQLVAGAQVQLTVTLSGPAGSAGFALSTGHLGAAACSLPSTLTVPSGKTTWTFTLETQGVDADTLDWMSIGDASANSVQVALTVRHARAYLLTLDPTSVKGGTASTAKIKLDGKAGPSGLVLSLASDKSAAMPPATVTVPPQGTSVSFSIATKVVTVKQTAHITAGDAYGDSLDKPLTITP